VKPLVAPNDFGFSIAGTTKSISLAGNRSTFEAALGEAVSSNVTEGDAVLIRLTWPGISILTQRSGSVWGIAITDPRFTTPRGLKVGQRLDDATRLYGKAEEIAKGVYIYSLTTESVWELRLKTGNGGQVVEIDFSVGD
jgi:hypothetical protein